MSSVFGILWVIAFIVYSVAQIIAGFTGIADGIGSIWAWIAIFAALALRITLPITIGAFFGAMNIWGWHWTLAALFAAPGLLLIIPGILASIFSFIKR